MSVVTGALADVWRAARARRAPCLSRAVGIAQLEVAARAAAARDGRGAHEAAGRVRHAHDSVRDVLDLARSRGERRARRCAPAGGCVRASEPAGRRRRGGARLRLGGQRRELAAGRRALGRRERRRSRCPPPPPPRRRGRAARGVHRDDDEQRDAGEAARGQRAPARPHERGHGDRRGGRGKPAAARASSRAAHAGSGRGGSSRRSSPSSASSGGRCQARHRRPPGAWSWRGGAACRRWRR